MLKESTEKQKIKYAIWFTIIIFVTLFIFGNSFVGYETSQNISNSVSEIILPNEYVTNESTTLFIRKSAHLIEFAALGVAVMLFVKFIEKDFKRKLYSTALFYVLLVAVLDEHIQSFSDRGSSTRDILLDFLGAFIGFSIVLTIYFLCAKLKNQNKFLVFNLNQISSSRF